MAAMWSDGQAADMDERAASAPSAALDAELSSTTINSAAIRAIVDPHDASAPIACGTVIRCPHTQLPVTTPFKPAAWLRLLATYPDSNWAHRLVHDLVHGVNIGYRGPRTQSRDSRNLTASPDEEAAVTADLVNETALHHIAGPYTHPPFNHHICSPLKTVPKKGRAGTFRIIHHLSHPHGRSINSFTADWPCPLAGFDNAIQIVRTLGAGCYMAKVDVKAAYRCTPVRPADWPLLGMRWSGLYYFHRTLPFGLRSACHLWERYATAMEWIIRTHFDVRHITHYVDDSFLANRTEELCARDLARAKAGMDELGTPAADDKTEGPATVLTYLGIRIDSVAMSISLDATKLASIREVLHQWLLRSTCSLRQLQSLVGTLHWAAYVVRHGRTFLQCLRDLVTAHDSSPLSTRTPLPSLLRPETIFAGGNSTSISGTASVCYGKSSGWTALPYCSRTPTPASKGTPPSAALNGSMVDGLLTRSTRLVTPPWIATPCRGRSYLPSSPPLPPGATDGSGGRSSS